MDFFHRERRYSAGFSFIDMYCSSHGIPRAASVHGTTNTALPGGLKDSDPLTSQSCEHLDSKNFLVRFTCCFHVLLIADKTIPCLISNLYIK